MIKLIQFATQSYQSRSLPLSAQRCLNLFAEKNPPDTKTPVSLFGAPGIDFVATVGSGPIRAMRVMQEVLYIVSSSHLYSYSSAGVITDLGSVGSATGPVVLSDNGFQLFILNNQVGYILSTSVTSPSSSGGAQENVLVGSTSSLALTAATAATTLYLTLTNTLPFWQSGDTVTVNLDNGEQFNTTILTNDVTIVTLTAPLDANASIGNKVEDTTTSVVTAMTAFAGTGATQIEVANATNINNGNTIVIAMDHGKNFTTTVVSVNHAHTKITINNPLPSQASVGNGISNTTVRIYLITDPNFFPADTVSFFDNYFILNRTNTNQFFFSALGDGTTFPGLNFGSAQTAPSEIRAILTDHELLLLFTDHNIETWYDSGAASFPFQRYSGATIERGCGAPASVLKEDNAIFFLGDDRIFYRLQGVLPMRISTHAIEGIWEQYSTVFDLVAYSYSTEGHKFIVLTFPTGNATWVYDISTGMWHERDSLDSNGNSIGRWRASSIVLAYNKLYVGDFTSANLGILSWNSFTEFGNLIRGQVISPPLRGDRARVFIPTFELEMQTGVGLTPVDDTPANNSPVLTLADPFPSQAFIGNEVWDSSSLPETDGFRTSLRTIAAPGATTIVVSSANDIGINDTLNITLDDGNVFITTVARISSPTNPEIFLDVSKDGGFTYSTPQRPRSLGKVNQHATRIRWLRLGQSRLWYLRLTITDPVQRVVVAAYADLYAGM